MERTGWQMENGLGNESEGLGGVDGGGVGGVVRGVLAKLLSNLCSSAPLLLNFYGSQM